MKKIILFLFILGFINKSKVFAESVKTFLDIPFGSSRIDTCTQMFKKGWKPEEIKENQVMFAGGDLNYESFVMFDKITLTFTEYGKFYHTRFILLERSESTKNLETYVKNIIDLNQLEFVTSENSKNVYISKDGDMFSYQFQDTKGMPFLIIEKGNPLILTNESRFEDYNPHNGIYLQSGNGFDFYYMVCDHPYIDGNIVYLSKSKDFNTVVYLYLASDPEGIKIANYIDKNKNFIRLIDLVDKYEYSTYKVKWCTKLLVCE